MGGSLGIFRASPIFMDKIGFDDVNTKIITLMTNYSKTQKFNTNKTPKTKESLVYEILSML